MYLIIFSTSFLISLLLTPIVKKLAIKTNFVDDPTRLHPAILHTTILPRAGGIAMFIAFTITSILFAQRDVLLWGILAGSLVNVTVGTLDDKYDIAPLFRLGFQVLTGIIVVIAGVSFYTTNPFTGDATYFDMWNIVINNFTLVIPGDILLIFWVMLLENTTNWTKGASQLPGVATVAFLTIAAVALKYQAGNPYQVQTAILAVAAAGSVLAFFPFNYPPEKMLPGFGASTFIGFLLAVLAVLSGGKVAALLVVFAIPIIDAMLVGTKRILSGKSPLHNDREHLYHFLLDAGWNKQKIIWLYMITGSILGFAAVMLNSMGKMIVITTVTLGITILFYSLYYKNKKGPTSHST